MKVRLPLNTKFSAELISMSSVKSIIPIGSWWEFEQWRNGKLIDQWANKNVNTTEGLSHMLNAIFHGSTQITTWYIGLFENDYTPTIADTYAVPGFTESSAYTAGIRQEFVEASASILVTTNTASKASFTINDTKTVYGAFLCGGGSNPTVISNTAGGGVLFASSKFTTPKSVVSTDVLMVSCSITLADV